jgi:hypothetical protein
MQRPRGHRELKATITAIKRQKGRNEPDSSRPDNLSCHAMIGRERKLRHETDKTQISPHAWEALPFVLRTFDTITFHLPRSNTRLSFIKPIVQRDLGGPIV